MNRRKYLIGASTVFGVGALATLPKNSKASIDNFNIKDANKTVENEITAILVVVDLDYSFEVSEEPTEVMFSLKAGEPNSSTTMITSDRLTTGLDSAMSDTRTIEGQLSYAIDFGLAEFQPSLDQPIEKDVKVELTMKINGANGELGSDTVSDTATIQVSQEAKVLDTSLEGNGEITFEE